MSRGPEVGRVRPAGEPGGIGSPSGPTFVEGTQFRRARQRMMATLAARGISDERVLALMGRIPRQFFAPEALAAQAYGDHALPVLDGQTLTQPYIVALCAQEVRTAGAERVLEIGTGSGYQAAVLAGICKQVFSVERNPRLLALARTNLDRLDLANVALLRGDGTIGWSRFAPYDAVLVAAAAPSVPVALLDQLRLGGRMLIPLGPPGSQQLFRVTRELRGTRAEPLGSCSFVPLVGVKSGAPAPPSR
jgi:protein-L-isoaspartate(D-aspartate) O-methyltransferase